MKINPIKKKSLKAEYENGTISMDELLIKHKIKEEDLLPTAHWKKKDQTPLPELVEMEVLPSLNHQDNITHLNPTPPATQDSTIDSSDSFLEEVFEIKKTALEKIRVFVDTMDEFTETKEVKDILSVLKDLEAGELTKQGKGLGNIQNNNIMVINNIISGFKDDC